MTLNYVRQILTFIPVLGLVLVGCNEGGGAPQCITDLDCPATAVCVAGLCVDTQNLGDSGIVGCTQPSFPDDQPDMSPLFPPEFVTEDGQPQRQVRPGQELLADVTVNSQTRKVIVEITDTWTPERVILAQEVDTSGSETIRFSFLTQNSTATRGFFFMRIMLCGDDCNARQVLFDLVEPDLQNQTTTGINVDYERTLIEAGQVIQVDQTCIRPFSILIQ